MMPKPKIYRDTHPFAPGYPWRARLDGLSWPCRTWQEALEKTAVHLHSRRADRTICTCASAFGEFIGCQLHGIEADDTNRTNRSEETR